MHNLRSSFPYKCEMNQLRFEVTIGRFAGNGVAFRSSVAMTDPTSARRDDGAAAPICPIQNALAHRKAKAECIAGRSQFLAPGVGTCFRMEPS